MQKLLHVSSNETSVYTKALASFHARMQKFLHEIDRRCCRRTSVGGQPSSQCKNSCLSFWRVAARIPALQISTGLQSFKTALFYLSQAGIKQGGPAPVIRGKAVLVFLVVTTHVVGHANESGRLAKSDLRDDQ